MRFDTRKIIDQIDEVAEQSAIEDYFARNKEGELVLVDAVFLNGLAIIRPLVVHKTVTSSDELHDFLESMTEKKHAAALDIIERDYQVVSALASAGIEFARRANEINGAPNFAEDKAKYLSEPLGILMLGIHCIENVKDLRASMIHDPGDYFAKWLEKYPLPLKCEKEGES